MIIFKASSPLPCKDLQPQELRNMACYENSEKNFKGHHRAFMLVYSIQILWECIFTLWAFISNNSERKKINPKRLKNEKVAMGRAQKSKEMQKYHSCVTGVEKQLIFLLLRLPAILLTRLRRQSARFRRVKLAAAVGDNS